MKNKPTAHDNIKIRDFDLVPDGGIGGAVSPIEVLAAMTGPQTDFSAFDELMRRFSDEDAYDPRRDDGTFPLSRLDDALQLIIFGSYKGGGGKSTACMAFIERLMRAGRYPVVIEADPVQKEVGETFKNDKKLRVLELPLANREGMEKLAMIMARRLPLVVVNAPGGLTEPFERFGGALRLALKTYEYRFTMFWLLNSQDQVVESLNAFWEAMPSASVHPIVNLKESENHKLSDFRDYIDHEIRKRVEKQGRTLVMPFGPMAIMNQMAKRHIPFGTLCHDDAYDILAKAELHTWLTSMWKEFDRVIDFEARVS
ncbi:MAG: hypothetical protein B7Z40_17135 [Bosea sp. 12-68-7]|nr:MAG: hypothetical protein B7Z40_17135 [Bosea sp. 12-68-7]